MPAVLLVARWFAGEGTARRAAPFLALAPMALFVATTGDAVFMALAALAAAIWLVEGEAFMLVLFVPLAAGGMQGKGEGIPELLLFTLLVSLAFGWRRLRRVAYLWGGFAIAFATWLPWYAWRHIHHVANVYSLSDSLNPVYLLDHTDRLHIGLWSIEHHYFGVHEWPLLAPVVVSITTGRPAIALPRVCRPCVRRCSVISQS